MFAALFAAAHLLLATGEACLGPEVEADLLERRLEALSEIEAAEDVFRGAGDEKRAAFSQFASCLDREALAALPVPRLERLFFLIGDHGLRDAEAAAIAPARAVLDIVNEKAGASPAPDKGFYRLLIAHRRFGEAADFAASRPGSGLLPVPLILAGPPAQAGHRALFRPSPDGRALKEEQTDMRRFTGVIMVGHPRCGFSAAAMEAITQDAAMTALMEEHGLMITDAAARLGDPALRAWNVRHPRLAYRHVVSQSAWPEVSYWGTPSFFVLKEGEVVSKLVGWPKVQAQSRIDELRQAALAAGLAVSPRRRLSGRAAANK